MDPNVTPQPVMCEVCGTYFETRRGLSSHARLHLRQLGVTLSESSGAPIELLYQIIQERDGSLPNFKTAPSAPVPTPPKKTGQQEPRRLSVPQDRGSSSKAGGKVTTTPQRTASQGSPASLKESTSLLPSSSSSSSSSSTLRASESRISEDSNSSSVGLHQATAKPLWAPQETDAPLTLGMDTNDEVHVCQLCGSWYETRKGLSSHARAHLRQIGLAESDTKGSPIEFLYKIMEAEDLKPISSEQQEPFDLQSRPKSSTKRPSHLSPPPVSKEPLSSTPLQSPPSKRAKASEKFTCILCGEEFENRKGLGSHSRSHLRQMGVVDMMGKCSAIDTIQELVSSGVLPGIQPRKKNTTTNSSVALSPAPPPAPAPAPAPPPAPSPSLSPFPSPSLSPPPAKCTQPPLTSVNRAPKAKKGFRLAVDPLHRKPKPEPVEIEMSIPTQGCSSSSSTSPQRLPSLAVNPASFNTVSSSDVEPLPVVLCDFCGQFFDSRKALSCHVRAHLRQLGLTWSIKTSPIDLLKEFMIHGQKVKKESVFSADSASGKAAWASQGSRRSLDSLLPGDPATKSYTAPLDFSLKEKSPSGKSGASHTDTSCELCGFDFDNRKALASHARAHLRQLGVTEWKTEGATNSPIEFLSEWIQKEPAKVAEITKRYRMGDLYIKKSQRAAPSPSLSTDSDSVPGGSLKPSGLQPEHRVGREEPGVTGGSFRAAQERPRMERGHTHMQAVRGDLGVRSPRGFYPPKRLVPTGAENQDNNSQQPPRTGNIPALLPKPPLTPLVKLVGKVYSLKCRFCEEVFHGPLSIQEDWIAHLQKHILSLGYKGKASPSPTPVATPALVDPVAV
ncbi:protein Wiz [Centroberyx affinis]|uniref:protein Wiz n=1 Tax=Centroberyx affinis TaxID=166261 RepID=UPI003A5BB4F5